MPSDQEMFLSPDAGKLKQFKTQLLAEKGNLVQAQTILQYDPNVFFAQLLIGQSSYVIRQIDRWVNLLNWRLNLMRY